MITSESSLLIGRVIASANDSASGPGGFGPGPGAGTVAGGGAGFSTMGQPNEDGVQETDPDLEASNCVTITHVATSP